jgi:hypothetical protein
LARRFLSTARPARVLIRARKPCLRARRRLLGWNVRFKRRPPRRPGHHDQAGWPGLLTRLDQGAHCRAPDRCRLGVSRSAWQPGTLSAVSGGVLRSSALPGSPLSTVVDNGVDVPSRWPNALQHLSRMHRRTVNGTQSDRNTKACQQQRCGGAC